MKSTRKKQSTAFLMLTCMTWCAVACVQLALSTQDTSNETVESHWRMTKYGWMDATTWAASWTEPARTIDFIHPILLAVMILLFAVWAMIWASSEWDVERLFSNNVESNNSTLDADSAKRKKSCKKDCSNCRKSPCGQN